MAMSQIDSEFAATVQIESVQTVLPFAVTDPRETCLVSVKDPVGSNIFRGCFNIVLCYNKGVEEDSGWLVAGWIKESLGRTMIEQPMLGGRLRRGDDGNGELEMVSNDSGARLIEAKIAMTLREFLGLEEREKLEAKLVIWKDIDEKTPQFSPLLFVQVTNFQCGGYSIGISVSLLLADLLIMENFIESHTPSERGGKTMILKIPGDTEMEGVENNELFKRAASLCVEKAEQELGCEMSSGFSLFVKESSTVLRVQNCRKNEPLKSHLTLISAQVISSSLDDLGIKELDFHEGNKPVHVSCWTASVFDGFVVAIPSPNGNTSSDINVLVTIPEGK
ncbi:TRICHOTHECENE 3-O-ACETYLTRANSFERASE [Salix viminalis]|uniref:TRICHOTHECENE 3-O-ACETYLTRANSFERASE n=1 Tax=Salix viminalis TaxID=40686 RepID=A0A9Q0TNR1_SALVM|nr:TRICHOTHECENE 3-O-ACETYLTRANSFERASE [Salix viminalis]